MMTQVTVLMSNRDEKVAHAGEVGTRGQVFDSLVKSKGAVEAFRIAYIECIPPNELEETILPPIGYWAAHRE